MGGGVTVKAWKVLLTDVSCSVTALKANFFQTATQLHGKELRL